MFSKAYTTPTIPVTNLARARQFYEGILGFTPLDAVLSYGVLTYRLESGALFNIYERSSATSGDHTAANIYVHDVDLVADELSKRGATIEPIQLPPDVTQTVDERGVICDDGVGVAFFIKDPDGNWLGFNAIREELQEILGWIQRED